MTNGEGLITVAIPVFGTPAALLEGCMRSVASADGPPHEVFVVVDGPQALDVENVLSTAGGLGFHVLRQTERVGLVANWNACLQLGSRKFIHVLHADDAVHPEFYRAVEGAAHPNVAMVAAGRLPVGPATYGTNERALGGRDAASYLLSHQKPPTGSFVLRRSALGKPARGFEARFPYCPDEELFLRLIASGDLALVDHHLYVESRHDKQARLSTWHRPDFADVYYAARIEGAGAVDADLVRLARCQTSQRLLSVGRYLCRAGDERAARAVARSIIAQDKHSLLNWKYWALLLLSTRRRKRPQVQGQQPRGHDPDS